MPVAVRNRATICRTACYRLAGQTSCDFMGIIQHGINRNNNRQHNTSFQQEGPCRFHIRHRFPRCQGFAKHRRNQPQANQNRNPTARPKLPPIKAGFPDGPDQTGNQKQAIERQQCRFAFKRQEGSNQKSQPCQCVVPTATNRDQPDTTTGKCKTNQGQQPGRQEIKHGIRPRFN